MKIRIDQSHGCGNAPPHAVAGHPYRLDGNVAATDGPRATCYGVGVSAEHSIFVTDSGDTHSRGMQR